MSAIHFAKRHYLPLALLSAIAFSLIYPAAGTSAAAAAPLGIGAASWCVIWVFLLSGLQFNIASLPSGNRLGKVLAAGSAVNLLGGPALAALSGAGLTALGWTLPAGLLAGLTIMMAVPTTLSSGIVLARQARGNESLAILLTLTLNVLGTATTAWFTRDIGGIDFFPQLQRLSALVVLPLLLGMGLRRFLGWKLPSHWGFLPSVSIIAMVWMSVGKYQSTLINLHAAFLAEVVGATLLLHLALVGLASLTAAGLHLGRPERASLILVAGQKTLPLSLLILMAHPKPGPWLPSAVAFCIVFHFTQIVTDSLLAARLAAKSASIQVQ